MSNVSTARPDEPRQSPWRICCISPRRSVVEQLMPAVMRCFPGASVSDIRHYPARNELPREFGAVLPDVCFVDVITDRARALALIPDILAVGKRIHVLVLLAENEPDLMLKCLRVGATEFLFQPFGADQLQAALPKIVRRVRDQSTLGRIFCVIPAKGACGASTVACNLAFQFKRLGSKRILLADMDPLTGTISFLLKLNCDYTFIDVLQRAETLDADLWKGMVTNRDGVDILLAPELLMQGINDVRDASPILDFAARNYDVVILDGAGAYGSWNLSQARGADEILLVTTNELPAVNGAQRSLTYLDANDIPRSKSRVIINRYEKSVGLAKEAVAAALRTEIVDTIPSDYVTMQKCLINGRPIPPNSGLGKTFAQLSDKLMGREKEPPPRSAPFGALLSFFMRT